MEEKESDKSDRFIEANNEDGDNKSVKENLNKEEVSQNNPSDSKNANINNDYSYAERLQVPYIEKKNGDEMIKENNYDEALKHFSKAIMAVKLLNDENILSKEELEKYVKEVGIPSNLNISLCYLKQKDWESVIAHTNRVIEFDKTHVKARYRRCLAYIYLNKFDQADEDLIELEELIGGTRELEDLEELFEKRKKENKESENLIYRKMFKKYVEIKDKNESEEMKNRLKNVFQKTPSAAKSIFNIAVDWAVVKPWNFIVSIPLTLKSYIIDTPVNFIANKCRRDKKVDKEKQKEY